MHPDASRAETVGKAPVRTVDLSPVTAEGDWRDRLERVLTSYAELLFEYPGLAQSAMVARPSGSDSSRRAKSSERRSLLRGVSGLIGSAPSDQSAAARSGS